MPKPADKTQQRFYTGQWYFVRKDKYCPEVALYGTKDGKTGFHLLWEDGKVYQAEDFVMEPVMAINPTLLTAFNKLNDKKSLTEEESKQARLFTCYHCVVEGCPINHQYECFKIKFSNIFPFFKVKTHVRKRCC